MQFLQRWASRKSRRTDWYLNTQSLVATLLHEPLPNAGLILDRSIRLNQQLQKSYLAALRNPAALLKRIDRVSAPIADTLRLWLYKARPCILASAHMASYLVSLMIMVKSVQKNETLIILRRHQETDAEKQLINVICNQQRNVQSVIFTTSGLKQSLRHLRAGHHIIMMLDVPLHFGINQGVPVRYFGRPLIVASAIAKMAIASQATIIPAALIGTGHSEFVSIRPPWQPEQTTDSPAEVMQRLFDDLEYWVRTEPDSWLLWGDLGEWFHASAQVMADNHAQIP